MSAGSSKAVNKVRRFGPVDSVNSVDVSAHGERMILHVLEQHYGNHTLASFAQGHQDFLHVQMLKARRTCSMTSFRMKTRREGTQKIVMIELSLTLHQHHKNLKN
uniref:Uncharacterized protein n=1 Tax=Helianthus annuus TaxID=4232 RepID=A0A251RY51_HELAN